MTAPRITAVNIRPQVSVLSVLSHLDYRPWFALAEFIDNALQSYEANQDDLKATGVEQLEISIEFDSGLKQIRIRDNAAGIATNDVARAFRPAEAPPDASGLSEFGMGMKSAACWFSPKWRVRSTALGEPIERTVTFDIERILEDKIEELSIEERKVGESEHYTVIELDEVRPNLGGRTGQKIRQHLSDIYREYLRSAELKLKYRGEPLVYEEPPILESPFVNRDGGPSGDSVAWKKEISFDFGDGMSIHGFAGLRDQLSTKYAGFSLLRRGRVIEGTGDEKYRPAEICGSPGSFRHKRLFGELHLSGFEVSHTKDGFRWDKDDETVFLELLKEHLNDSSLPLLEMADNFRERARRAARGEAGTAAIKAAGDALQKHGPDALPAAQAAAETGTVEPAGLPIDRDAQQRIVEIEAVNRTWRITLELSPSAVDDKWLTLAETPSDGSHELSLRISLESPFMRQVVDTTESASLEPVVRLAAGLGLAEHLARVGGCNCAGSVRRSLNELLSHALCYRT